MVNNENIDKVTGIIKKEIKKFKEPVVGIFAKETKDPFAVLISTMISLRTKDDVTTNASRRLFSLAKDPQTMLKLSARQIEKAIYPAGFYRVKAKSIKATSKALMEKFGGKVPAFVLRICIYFTPRNHRNETHTL